MTLWTNEKLEKTLQEEELVVPFDAKHIQQAAYELGVAAEYAVTEADGEGRRHEVKEGDFIRIEPGQFALLLTKEVVRVPDRAMAFISVKASWKLRGLVNVSGFHADPGFHGRLKFAVYNASGQTLDIEPGRRLFLIWFNNLIEPIPSDKLYKGKHQDQDGIRDEDLRAIRGMVASPAGLSTRITSLGERVTVEVSKLEAALTKTVDDAKHHLVKEISDKNHDLAIKIERISTQQGIQWFAIASVLIIGLAMPQLRDCNKKDEKATTPTSQIATPPSDPASRATSNPGGTPSLSSTGPTTPSASPWTPGQAGSVGAADAATPTTSIGSSSTNATSTTTPSSSPPATNPASVPDALP